MDAEIDEVKSIEEEVRVVTSGWSRNRAKTDVDSARSTSTFPDTQAHSGKALSCALVVEAEMHVEANQHRHEGSKNKLFIIKKRRNQSHHETRLLRIGSRA